MKTTKYKTLTYNEKEFKSLSGLWKIDRVILDTIDFEDLAEKVVNVILTELDYLKLGYSIIVLTLVNKKGKSIERVSISKTKAAQKALESTPIPFEKIKVPLTASQNLLVKAIKNQKIYFTHDLSDVLYPEASREIWREIQKACEIKTSMIIPIISKKISLGAMIFSISKNITDISKYEKEVLTGFTNAVGLAIEHVYLYRSLREANKKLKELDKMKDEFVSVASHELRTPMTSIKNYLWMVLNDKAGKVPQKQRFYLQRVATSTERLIELVNDMLTISRIERGKIEVKTEPGDIVCLARSVILELKGEADKKKIKLSLKTPKEKLPLILLDEKRIREVFFNLIGNSLKFTDSGGKIIVSFEKNSKTVTTFISDTGKGIAKENLPRLFKKFGRLDRSFAKIAETAGTGLGLYISKQIIDLHRGKISVDSELGEGSVFYFELRIAKGGEKSK
ncbi:ATP-binding protein [Patescibacteria group bacterium]